MYTQVGLIVPSSCEFHNFFIKFLEHTTKNVRSWKKRRVLQKRSLMHVITTIIAIITTTMIFHTGLSLPRWFRKLSIRYLQNILLGTRKNYPLTVKSNSWPSRSRTVWNKVKNEQKIKIWRL